MTRFLASFLLVGMLLTFSRSIKSQVKQTTINLRGVVQDAATGINLPRTTVRVAQIPATADSDGEFTLPNLKTGRYNVTASRPGFLLVGINGGYAPEHPIFYPNGLPVMLSDDMAPLRVMMLQAPIVSGTIVDSTGQPIERAEITAHRLIYDSNGQPVLNRIPATVRTDDHGEFRSQTWIPGEYTFSVEKESSARGTFALAYIPGPLNIRQPRTVRVELGNDLQLGTTVMTAALSATLNIRLLDQTGKELPPDGNGAMIAYRRQGDLPIKNIVLQTSPSVRLAEGTYDVEGSFGPLLKQTDSGMRESMMLARASVEIRDKDVSLPLLISPGNEVVGKIVKREKDGTLLPVPEAQVRLVSQDSLLYSVFRSIPSKGGDFRFPSIPSGMYRLSIPLGGQDSSLTSDLDRLTAPHLCVSEVRQDDVQVDVATLDVRRRTRMDVILMEPAARITGRIVDAQGRGTNGAIVVLVPDDHASRRYSTIAADQDGNFEIMCARPGSYHLYSWRQLPGEAYRSEEFMRQFESSGQQVRLLQGDRLSVTVRLTEQ